jgi:hypothetical protein
MRKQAFFHAGHKDHGPFQAFGSVDGADGDGVTVFVVNLATALVGVEADVGQIMVQGVCAGRPRALHHGSDGLELLRKPAWREGERCHARPEGQSRGGGLHLHVLPAAIPVVAVLGLEMVLEVDLLAEVINQLRDADSLGHGLPAGGDDGTKLLQLG